MRMWAWVGMYINVSLCFDICVSWTVRSPTHSFIHSLTYALAHSCTHLLTHPPTDSLTHTHTHSLIHSHTHTRAHSFTHTRAHPTSHNSIHAHLHIHAPLCCERGLASQATTMGLQHTPHPKHTCIIAVHHTTTTDAPRAVASGTSPALVSVARFLTVWAA